MEGFGRKQKGAKISFSHKIRRGRHTLFLLFTGICFGYSKKNYTNEHKQVMLYEIINVLVSVCFYVITTIRVFHNLMYIVVSLSSSCSNPLISCIHAEDWLR